MLKRTLEKSGKSLDLEATDHDTALELIDQSKAKVKQGWTPAGKPADAVKLAKQFLKLGLTPDRFIVAFSADEVDAVYKQLIRDDEESLRDYALRARPTRALLEHLMSKEYNLLGSELSKAIKFICKDEAVATWVRDVMEKALADKPSPALKKFATQQLKNLTRRAEVPDAPKVEKGNETSLLQQIAARPEDDEPRLVYADFLTEKGIGWGEVIPLLLKPAPEYGTPEYELLDKQVKKHLKGWLEPIRPFITGWSVHEGRGLLSSVDTQPGKFIQAAEAISLRAPRATLTLSGLKVKEVPALAATPLGRFAQVSLHSQRIDDAQLKMLAASPSVLGVSRWSLGLNHFAEEGFRALADSPNFASCTELEVQHIIANPVVVASTGLKALLASTKWPALRSLSISVVDVGSAFETCVVRLENLSLDAQNLDDGVLGAIAGTASLHGLTRLKLAWSATLGAAPTPFSESALLTLVEALPKLQYLAVPGQLPASIEALLVKRRA